MAERVERLTNLLALLLETRRPLSLVEISAELDGAYPEGLAARRGAFERDKAVLRQIGVPIETEVVAGGPEAGQTRYRVDRDRYELVELDLTDEERRALQVAVAATRGGTGSAQDALWKLGAGVADADVPAVAVVPSSPASAVLRDAVADRSVARFTYRGRAREVEPYGLLLREGFWYLVGRDRGVGERRTFRVDRIEGSVERDGVDEFDPPKVDLRAAVPSDPKLLPEPDADDVPTGPATVRLAGPRAELAVRAIGAHRVIARTRDGSVDIEVPFHNFDAFRSWILGLGAQAEVLAPDAARRSVVEWLTSIVDRSRAAPEVPPDATVRTDDVGARDGRSGRRTRSAEDRLRRLLVLLPWLMERGSVPLAEVSERFGAPIREITADVELASMCGLPPFVDELIDVFIDDDMIHVGVPRLFTRPLRLTSIEAFEVLAAARAALSLPGSSTEGPLARALDKVAAASGLGPDGGVEVEVDVDRPPFVEELAAAVAGRRVVELDYVSASSDEMTERLVVPRQVFTDRGNWYVVADDAAASDGRTRTYRVDRVLACRTTDEVGPELTTPLPTPGEWFVDADVTRAVLRIAERHRWVAERYPVDSIVGPDERGELTVTLPVAGVRWLERLLLRLGPDARVVAPAAWGRFAADAATQVLERYRDGTST